MVRSWTQEAQPSLTYQRLNWENYSTFPKLDIQPASLLPRLFSQHQMDFITDRYAVFLTEYMQYSSVEVGGSGTSDNITQPGSNICCKLYNSPRQ